MTIKISINSDFMNKNIRPECKYSPVKIADDAALSEMNQIKAVRKNACLKEALGKDYDGSKTDQSVKFSFSFGAQRYARIDGGPDPVFVISSGCAGKLKTYFSNEDYKDAPRLGWDLRHEQKMSGKRVPIFVFVHERELRRYEEALGSLPVNRNDCFIVGWSAGDLAGFGATRAAILHFAASQDFAWNYVVVMDQDVLYRPDTDFTDGDIDGKIKVLHQGLKKDRDGASQAFYDHYKDVQLNCRVVAYGVGYPTRVVSGQADKKLTLNKDSKKLVELPQNEIVECVNKTIRAISSPTQQFVSIDVSGLKNSDESKRVAAREEIESIYPFYMVAGGEDVVMTKKAVPPSAQVQPKPAPVNPLIRKKEIQKINIPGHFDENNAYEKLRNDFLEKLFSIEGVRQMESVRPQDGASDGPEKSSFRIGADGFRIGTTSVKDLAVDIADKVCVQDEKVESKEGEAWRISACIIERIIIARLRHDKSVRSASK